MIYRAKSDTSGFMAATRNFPLLLIRQARRKEISAGSQYEFVLQITDLPLLLSVLLAEQQVHRLGSMGYSKV